MNRVWWRVAAVMLASSLCAACSTPPTYRAHHNARLDSCAIQNGDFARCKKQTPEVWHDAATGDKFRIHFVEFDDQGWLHGDSNARNQIDWLMNDLTASLKEKKRLNLVLFVHGWKHNADGPDRDVKRFRQLLGQIAAQEAAATRQPTATRQPREVVGIYVGWRGRSWEHGTPLPDFLLNLTFWTRKAAAIRVAQGQARELFARLKTLQDHWNGERDGACRAGPSNTTRCAIRTLMVGHSLGAWIIYAAVSQSIVEVLAAEKDIEAGLPPAAAEKQTAAETKRRQLARLGDLILLVNPAFEGVRYEAVHKAQRAMRDSYDAPILVIVQSTVDVANRTAFPLGRFINTLFERETPAQKRGMRTTAGNVENYVTHDLNKAPETCAGWEETQVFTADKELELKPEYVGNRDTLKKQLVANLRLEDQLAREFFDGKQRVRPGGRSLEEAWTRHFCGGLQLTRRAARQGQAAAKEEPNHADPNSLIWNIRTHDDIILTHSDFMTPPFFNFVRQLYGDIGRPMK